MGRSSGTPYGCRGGTSATAGRKSATYELTLPSGETIRKRVFKVTAPEAIAHCSKWRGNWYLDMIALPGWAAPYRAESTEEVATVTARRV